jgi:hypothetical protein
MSVLTRKKHTRCFDCLGTEQKRNQEDRRQAHYYKIQVHRCKMELQRRSQLAVTNCIEWPVLVVNYILAATSSSCVNIV